MNQNNKLQAQKPRFSVAITTPQYQNLIHNTLKDPKRANRFIAAVSSAVAVNPQLQECDAGTILSAALLGESLNLQPSPQLGQYYMVPFKSKAKYDRQGNLIDPECTKAQFILGYKGYIQMALRSGEYADLDVIDIKEGEYLGKDKFTGKPQFSFIEDDDYRESLPTVGYMAYFEYLNGFRKVIYWSKDKIISHADQFSQAFSASAYTKLQNNEIPEKDMWKFSSFWYKDFDTMAKKTLLRQLISKWGIMSTEMVTAMESDGNCIIKDDSGNFIPDVHEQALSPELPPAEPEHEDNGNSDLPSDEPQKYLTPESPKHINLDELDEI